MFKPMLAATLEPHQVEQVRYPVYASPKLDGIRAHVRNAVLLSRSMKPIRNHYTQELFGSTAFEGLDGELIVGNPTDKDVYLNTNSGVMSSDGEPSVTFHVFDHTLLEAEFSERLSWAQSIATRDPVRIIPVPHVLIHNAVQLLEFEAKMTGLGFEGIMLRDPRGPYKHGRSTLREGWLLKLKRFLDDEAEVIGYEEQLHNSNAATVDALGHTERSSHKAGMVPMGVLGALRVRNKEGVEFSVGSGFTALQRAALWLSRDTLIGKTIKYKYFPVGVKDAPRFPTYLGFRDKDDM